LATMFLSLLPPPQKSLLCRLVVALMPPPLILLTLPPPLNAQPWPIEAPSPLVCWRISSHLHFVRRLVVASPVAACLRLVSPFVAQLPHASILDPSSLFAPAGCRIASLRTAFASRRTAVSRLAVSSPSPMRRHSLGCAFRRNSGGILTECGKMHRPFRFRTGTGAGMCYNTMLDIPVYSGWYLSTRFLQVENVRNYSK
jgi:hypothetical protein